MKFLVLADGFAPQYRVLRCAAALGHVFVLGSQNARQLGRSLHCIGFTLVSFDPCERAQLAAQIEEISARHRIDMVLPSDSVTTRALSTIQDGLTIPVFPIPETATFDKLDTKDAFMALCAVHGIPHPQGQLYAGRREVAEGVRSGEIRLPAMAKPINRSGSIGVLRMDAGNAASLVGAIDYQPILVQDAIAGADICISVFCLEGEIRSRVIYRRERGVFYFFEHPDVAKIIECLARDLKLRGVYNFDVRIGDDGKIWILECNPRFWFNMDIAMIAGNNFIEFGIDANRIAQREIASRVRLPHALLAHVLSFRRPRLVDWKLLAYWLADPPIAVREFWKTAQTLIARRRSA